MNVAAWKNAIQRALKISETPGNTERISNLLGSYMPALDGYRGVAILLVFMTHSFEHLDKTSFLQTICYEARKMGWCGVDAFFVLSGFLITGILLDTRERSHYFRNFYARRFLRIFPIYYLTLFIFFVLLYPVLSGYEFYDRLENIQTWYWLYLQNWEKILHCGPVGFNAPINLLGHLWSLAVEEQFYLLWPLIIYLVPRRFLGWLVGISILSPAIVRNAILLTHPSISFHIFYYGSFFRIDELACGGAIALLMRSEPWRNWLLRLYPQIAVLSGSIIGIICVIQQESLAPYQPVVVSIGYSLLAIFFCSVLVTSLVAAENNPLVRFLNWSPLRKLGRISYGFYFYHGMIILILRHRLPALINDSYILGDLLLVFCSGVLTLMVSLLSWYCLEQRILKLKRYFPRGELVEER